MRVYDLGPVIWDLPPNDSLRGRALRLLQKIRREVPVRGRVRLECLTDGYHHNAVLQRLDEFRYRLGGRGGPTPILPGEISAWNRVFRLIEYKIYPPASRGGKVRYVADLKRMHVLLPFALGLGALGYLARHQQAEGAEAVFG